jgi:hypothetical protein
VLAEISPSNKPSRALVELIGRALIDKDLRQRLLTDPQVIGQEFGISSREIEAVKHLDRQKFERAAARLRWG